MSTVQATNLKHGSSATNNVVLDASGNTTISGNATIGGNAVVTGTLQAGGAAVNPLVTATAVASTSGTSIDFTGIPSWARRITIMLDGVSTNSSSNLLLQLGTSSGIEATNYRGTAFYPGATYTLLTSGVILIQGGAAANIANGSLSFSLVTGNTWAGSGIISYSNAAAIGMVSFAKALGGVLDRVRFTTVGGTDTFDAGNVNIQYD